MSKPLSDCEAVIVARPFYSETYKRTMYMADVVGGPGSLVARETPEATISDGLAYLSESWEPAPGGGWQTIRYSGPFRPGKDFL